MRADGSAPHALSSGRLADDAAPAWSPNGRWIAFVRRQRGDVEREIWVMRPDGSGARRLTSLHGSSINPAWSPDGRRIVFASNIVGSLYDLYVIALSDRRVRRTHPQRPRHVRARLVARRLDDRVRAGRGDRDRGSPGEDDDAHEHVEQRLVARLESRAARHGQVAAT